MTPEEMREELVVVRETRAKLPEIVRNRYAVRHRRALLGHDGRLMLIAADHPARGALGVRSDGSAMADRASLLARLVTALRRPGVDGLVATADVLDDLLIMGELEDKVIIGSMNRGGLQGASFELDDRFTGFDVETIATSHLEGGKMLCRIALDDPGTASTLEGCAHAVTALAKRGLMAMLEPFWSTRADGRVVNDLSTAAVVKSVTVAAGLGARSNHTWLKLPVVDGLDEVMAATTLPTLLLGGDPSGAPDQAYESWRRALAVPGVRGLVIGRALLFPPDGDVAAAVDIAVSLVHDTRLYPPQGNYE